AGREGDAGGYHRLVPQEPRRLQMSALRRVRRTAADLDRENPEVQAARHGEDGVTMASRAVATGIGVNPSRPSGARHRQREQIRNVAAFIQCPDRVDQRLDVVAGVLSRRRSRAACLRYPGRASGLTGFRAGYSAAVCRNPRCRSERSVHSRVSFSCTPFWLSRARRLSKSTRSRSWSWLKQENTTLSTPLTGSRWTCRHCAQISFIMHCIGELMEAIALCPGLRCGASIPC